MLDQIGIAIFILFATLIWPAHLWAETLTLTKVSAERCLKHKEADACFELGHIYQNSSQPKNIEIGQRYSIQGCRLLKKRECDLAEANTLSTERLAAKKVMEAQVLKYKQQEAEKNTPKTKDEIACKNEDGEACYKAAIFVQFVAPVTNPATAKTYYEAGCKLGHKGSCDALELVRKGIGKVYDVEM